MRTKPKLRSLLLLNKIQLPPKLKTRLLIRVTRIKPKKKNQKEYLGQKKKERLRLPITRLEWQLRDKSKTI